MIICVTSITCEFFNHKYSSRILLISCALCFFVSLIYYVETIIMHEIFNCLDSDITHFRLVLFPFQEFDLLKKKKWNPACGIFYYSGKLRLTTLICYQSIVEFVKSMYNLYIDAKYRFVRYNQIIL